MLVRRLIVILLWLCVAVVFVVSKKNCWSWRWDCWDCRRRPRCSLQVGNGYIVPYVPCCISCSSVQLPFFCVLLVLDSM